LIIEYFSHARKNQQQHRLESVDTSKPVLVTGATGYITGVLIQQLLEHGVTVHAAVRDPSNEDKLEHLTKAAELCASKGGSIKFFYGNLLEESSYDGGMKGCSVVFHTASPCVLDSKDPQKELITPAVEETKILPTERNL
jgi:dihydroflavonol-4-reductase